MHKCFMLSRGRSFFVGAFPPERSRDYIIQEMRMIAINTGNPIHIDFHRGYPYVVSPRTDEELKLRRKLKSHQDALARREQNFGCAVKRVAQRRLKKEIRQLRSNIRNLERKLRSFHTRRND